MRTAYLIGIFLGALLTVSIAAFAQNSDKKQSADLSAIEKVRADLDAAYNKRDAAAFSALFLDDADFQWHTGDVLNNRKEIYEHFTQAFKKMPPDYRHITTFRRMRFLKPDIAIGDGTVVIAREGAAENEAPYLKVLLTAVGRKSDGVWRIAAVRLMLPKTK
jgi:uncharacterized protein (TIGR02246 family)